MRIDLYYEDEYIEEKCGYSYETLTFDDWDEFWRLWNISLDIIRCDNAFHGGRIYLKKDRVFKIVEVKELKNVCTQIITMK